MTANTPTRIDPGTRLALQRQLGARRANRAVQLRAMGFTYAAIAAHLLPCPDHQPSGRQDCDACLPMFRDKSAAKKAVDRALADEYASGSEAREKLRRQQLSRIDTLLTRVMREALAPGGNDAARVAVRLLERQAKLLGLDAPTRVTVDTELDRQIEEALEALGLNPTGPSVLS